MNRRALVHLMRELFTSNHCGGTAAHSIRREFAIERGSQLEIEDRPLGLKSVISQTARRHESQIQALELVILQVDGPESKPSPRDVQVVTHASAFCICRGELLA